MAIPTGFPGFGSFNNPPVTFDRARREGDKALPGVPEKPPAGSLVIVDTFQDSFMGAAHGNVGTFAAQQHGFRGKVYAENIGPDQPTGSRAWDTYQKFNAGPMTPEQTRAAVRDFARHNSSELLNNVAGDLDKLRGKGLHDSAVNVSYGTTPARMADQLMNDIYSTKAPFSPNVQLAKNVFNAYQIDMNKLDSKDPKVSGPELKRLQDALLKDTRAGMSHPDVKAAQQNYDRSVQQLQGQHNSVVVSAGNDQAIGQAWKREANGYSSVLTQSDYHNPLANADVTTVGATQWTRGPEGLKERVAGYSNLDPTVDVYASGSVGNGHDVNRKNVGGTSFSAPRVAGALATLHGNHPGANSVQMRNLMNNRLTHEVPGASAPVLDFQAAEEYMRRGTF